MLERRKRTMRGGNLHVARAGRLAGASARREAPGEDRAVVLERGEAPLVGGDRRVAGGGRRVCLGAAVGVLTPHSHRAVGLQRRERPLVAELLPRRAQGKGATHARAGPGALARQCGARRDIDLERLDRRACRVRRGHRHIAIHRGADSYLAADHPGAGVERQPRGEHSVGGDHQILDRVDIGVGRAGFAPDGKRPQRLVRGLPVCVVVGVKGQRTVHPHLEPPLFAHREGDRAEGGAADVGVGEQGLCEDGTVHDKRDHQIGIAAGVVLVDSDS